MRAAVLTVALLGFVLTLVEAQINVLGCLSLRGRSPRGVMFCRTDLGGCFILGLRFQSIMTTEVVFMVGAALSCALVGWVLCTGRRESDAADSCTALKRRGIVVNIAKLPELLGAAAAPCSRCSNCLSHGIHDSKDWSTGSCANLTRKDPVDAGDARFKCWEKAARTLGLLDLADDGKAMRQPSSASLFGPEKIIPAATRRRIAVNISRSRGSLAEPRRAGEALLD